MAELTRQPSDRLLQKRKKNEIFKTIQAVGLDPIEFDLEDNQIEVRIKHKSSESCFMIGGDPSHYVGRYLVGDGPEWPFDEYSWQPVIPRIRVWLEQVRSDLATPDLWAELQRETKLFRAYSDHTIDNTPFTQVEQKEIASTLRELVEYARHTYSLSEEQMRVLDAKTDYLIDATGRLGRIDWRNIVAGAIFGWLLAAALPPDSARDIVVRFFSAIGQFYGLLELSSG
jgi:hypothetical protein